MQLKIFGSGSAGNCYMLDNGKEALVIECGVHFRAVLEAIDFDISRIQGALISHEHGDHSAYTGEFLEAQIDVYCSNGTKREIVKTRKVQDTSHLHSVEAQKMFRIGEFDIIPFLVQHDAVEPFGYLIRHPQMGTTLFATDTYYLKYRFKGLNNIMIECNYRYDLLIKSIEARRISPYLLNRTLSSHLSYDTCLTTLKANDLSQVNNIVLIHLSSRNSNAKEFKEGISRATGKTVYVAEAGLEIEFNKTPF